MKTKKKAPAARTVKGQTKCQQTNYQQCIEKSRAERIAKRRADMPPKYRKLYDRCTNGKASPREAIRMQCLECWAWVQTETALCDNAACPLYQYRPYQTAAEVPDTAISEPKQARSQAGG